MEEYANYGFDLINDKQEDIEDYFYKENGFLNIFLEMMKSSSEIDNTSFDKDDDEPESLDEEDGVPFSSKEDNTIIENSEVVEKHVIFIDSRASESKSSHWKISDIKDATEYFKMGMTTYELAKLFNRDVESVTSMLKDKGLIK
jgi:hypothetical protein